MGQSKGAASHPETVGTRLPATPGAAQSSSGLSRGNDATQRRQLHVQATYPRSSSPGGGGRRGGKELASWLLFLSLRCQERQAAVGFTPSHQPNGHQCGCVCPRALSTENPPPGLRTGPLPVGP